MSPEMMIPLGELADILERNGFPGAASDIYAGKDVREATAYIVGREPLYDDGEGQWLHAYIDALHKTAVCSDGLHESCSTRLCVNPEAGWHQAQYVPCGCPCHKRPTG